MKSTSLTLAVTAVMLCFLHTTAAAVITTDPNIPGASPAEETPVSTIQDERLSQKVSYSGYKRLHTVLEELSQATGVTIISGKNRDDWQVRDIPVSVFVKDMPLGELLQAIADATHLALTSSKTDNKILYRMWRTSTIQKEADNHIESKQIASKQMTDWTYNTLQQCIDMPFESVQQPTKGKQYTSEDHTLCQSVGRLIRELGMPGCNESLRMVGRYAPDNLKPMITELYISARQKILADRSHSDPQAAANLDIPSVIDIDRFVLQITGHLNGDVSISALNVATSTGAPTSWDSDLDKLVHPLRESQKAGIPVMPKPVSPLRYEKTQNTGLMPVIRFTHNQRSLLHTKVILKAPKSEDELVDADLFQALCEQAGMNIVCEDFWSHKRPGGNPASTSFNREITIDSAINRHNIRWFSDPDKKLLVGQMLDWPQYHQNLAPEKMLLDIQKKLDSNGAGIDDFLPCALLKTQQIDEWISWNRNMPKIPTTPICERDRSVWQLYNLLSSKDKQLVRSESGFALAKCDPQLLEDALVKRASEMENNMKYYYIQYPSRWNWEWIPTDIKTAGTLTMYLRDKQPQTTPQDKPNGESSTAHSSLGNNKRSYYLQVTGKDGDKMIDVKLEMDLVFPLYSPKREAELAKVAVDSK